MLLEDLYAPPRLVENLEDCDFYHSMDLPNGEFIKGHVNLVGSERDYLGHAEFDAHTVLEVGPATGHLGFYMAQNGADVTSLELPSGTVGDLVPRKDFTDWEQILADRYRHMNRIYNSYWYCHAKLGSKNKLIYGTVEDLETVGAQFDIVVLAGVLLHFRDVQKRLEQFANLARKELIIAEQLLAPLDKSDQAPIAWLAPLSSNKVWDHWWRFSPGFFTGFLPILGFSEHRLTKHHQQCQGESFQHFTIRAIRTT